MKRVPVLLLLFVLTAALAAASAEGRGRRSRGGWGGAAAVKQSGRPLRAAEVVGDTGLGPVTFCMSSRRSNQLS